MNKKKKLGQFFTTNVNHILQGFEQLVVGKDIVDPYAGGGDLLEWAIKNGAKTIIGFDIDEGCCNETIRKNDSLLAVPLAGNFNITNPPFLAKNKMLKISKKKYLADNNIEDFYLLAMKRIVESNYDSGIIIVPVNFFSAENSDKIRKEFLSIYNVGRINYFTEQVFDDTTYNVVAFHYYKDNSDPEKRTLNINIIPGGKTLFFEVESKYDYRIGGRELSEILGCKNKLQIKRLTEDIMKENRGKLNIDGYFNSYDDIRSFKVSKPFSHTLEKNIITFECIDGKNKNNKIRAKDMGDRPPFFLVGKNTSRNIASIIMENCPDIDTQSKLVEMFNKKLFDLRETYNSLFLTNFRDNNRKRVSFDFCYKLLNYCYINYNDTQQMKEK